MVHGVLHGASAGLRGRALLEREGQRVRLETRRRMAGDTWTRYMEQAGHAMHEHGRLEALLEAFDETGARLAALQIDPTSAHAPQVGVCTTRQALCMPHCTGKGPCCLC